MYKYLSKAIKRRLIDELRYCFDSNPRHRDILPFIQQKYDFDERPQKGIIFQSGSANPLKLSADNFLGTLFSHVMLAHVDDRLGVCMDWVREDDRAIRQNQGVMPSEPGVYFIEIEEYTTTDGFTEYQFYVDPLMSVREEPVLEFVTGTESSAILANAPLLEASADLYAYPNTLLLEGSGLRLQADQSLYIGGLDDDTELSLGLPQGWIAPSVTTVSGPFMISAGTNDVLSFYLNGISVSATLPPGPILASDVEDAVRDALMSAGVSYTDYTLRRPGNAFYIEATQTLTIRDSSVSTANSALGITAGDIKPQVDGLMVQEHVPDRSRFRVVVDDTEVVVDLTEGNVDVSTIRSDIEEATSSTSLVVTEIPAGDYHLDTTTGDITFLHDFEPGVRVIADYKYPVASRGPFPIGTGEVANNEAIPGVVLAFSNQLQDGDVVAVVVTEGREEVAEVYGGKFDMSVELDILARDSVTRNDLSDLTMMYLWQWRKEPLAEEGIILNDVSQGAESEEPYDDVGDDYYYLSSVSISLYADWEVYVEKPYYIRRVTPTSFEQDAVVASGGTSESQLTATTDANLDDYRFLIVDGKGNLSLVR